MVSDFAVALGALAAHAAVQISESRHQIAVRIEPVAGSRERKVDVPRDARTQRRDVEFLTRACSCQFCEAPQRSSTGQLRARAPRPAMSAASARNPSPLSWPRRCSIADGWQRADVQFAVGLDA